MPITVKKPLPTASTIVAGSTARFDLPTGRVRYHRILMELTSGMGSATAVSDVIDEIRIYIDGRQVRRLKGSQIDYIANFNGAGYSSYANGNDPILMLHFAEAWRRNAGQEDLLAWGMADVGTFQIEIDIASGATNLKFSGFAEVDYVDAPLGDIKQIRLTKVPVTASGQYNLTTLPRDLPYLRLHSFSSDIAELKVVRNNETVYELTDEEAVAEQTINGLVPAASVFTVAFDQRQRIEDFLNVVGAQQFELEYTMTGTPSAFDLVVEQFGPVSR
jgi:hypothetical protein